MESDVFVVNYNTIVRCPQEDLRTRPLHCLCKPRDLIFYLPPTESVSTFARQQVAYWDFLQLLRAEACHTKAGEINKASSLNWQRILLCVSIVEILHASLILQWGIMDMNVELMGKRREEA